jgi:hypothetical protein
LLSIVFMEPMPFASCCCEDAEFIATVNRSTVLKYELLAAACLLGHRQLDAAAVVCKK